MKSFQKCDRVAAATLGMTVFLAILSFWPGGLIPSSILKGYLVTVFILVAFVAWLIGRLIEGSFHIPWTPILGAVGVLLVAMLVSAVFSHTPYLAFFGEGFEQGTLAVMGGLLLSVFLASVLFTTKRRIAVFLQGFLILYIILALFQLVHVFFPAATALGLFSNSVDSPVGLWGDFAVLSGAALIGSALILQFMHSMKKLRFIPIISFLLGLFFVILANIFTVWILVGVSAILILIYSLVSNHFSEQRHFPFLAFALSLVSLLFILANSLFGSMLANVLHASYLDVHPNLSATIHTLTLSFRDHPFFGAGPNRFIREWLTHRPAAVNNNTLWDVPFSSGSSFLLTTAFLGGGLGIIAVGLFVFQYLYESVRKSFMADQDTSNNLLVFGLFLMSLYFFLSITLYSPGIAVAVCAFMFIGVFIGTLVHKQRIPMHDFTFLKDQRAGFFSILCIVVLLLASAGAAYAATERFGALVFYEKSVATVQNGGNLDTANQQISEAIALSDLPSFERERVALAEQSIQKTLSLPADAASTDAVRTALQNAINTGNTAAQNAINIDPSDPANYLTMGDFLTLIIPFKIDGTLAKAEDAYNHAVSLAPDYPKTYLDLAEMYFNADDDANAKVYAEKALDAKSNYTDVYFLLSQIATSENNDTDALNDLTTATTIDPNNPDTYFELGLLHYNDADYQDAISAFTTTINLSNQYLNAWYYLALAYQKTGDSKDATQILTMLHTDLPSNTNITDALNGVSAPAVAPTPLPTPAAPAASSSVTSKKAKKLSLPSDASTTPSSSTSQ